MLLSLGVQDVVISVPEDLVVVDATLKTSEVHALLESTGLLVFFRGFGGQGSTERDSEQTAAVAVLKASEEQIGLVRMVQVSSSLCIVEINLDKLSAGEYFINVHQFGDISMGANSCGEVYCASNEVPPVGSLGRLKVDQTGASTLHITSEHLKVSSVIGRSIVVSSCDNQDWFMCGVIARSAGLFQNSKRLCTCDGVSIWDEAKSRQK